MRVGKVGEKEVDFVAEKHGDIAYSQVAYLLSEPASSEREYGSLEQIHDY